MHAHTTPSKPPARRGDVLPGSTPEDRATWNRPDHAAGAHRDPEARLPLLLVVAALVAACGGGDGAGDSAPREGQSGAAGSTPGAAGAPAGGKGGGSAATAGGAVAGAAGSAAGGAGGGGAGGSGAGGSGAVAGGGGAGGGPAGGGGGQAGSGGGGLAGAGQSGAAGLAGSAACNVADCLAKLPATTPPGCATATCQAGACVYQAKDADVDGHPRATCAATGVNMIVGDDCDDSDPTIHPGAWDGPTGDGNPNRCDGKDNDCSGGPDDRTLVNGTSCTCTPGDVKVCSETPLGQPIAFPKLIGGKPVGKCKLGAITCGSDGKWSGCVGAIPPEPVDLCNGGVDDDCDGAADLDDDVKPSNVVTWSFDGDGDNYASSKVPNEVRVEACPDKAPAACPASMPGCDLSRWKSVSLATVDCDDSDPNVSPNGAEICNGKDDDCNGVVDDAPSAPLWFFDYDGDSFGDVNTTPVRACTQPTTLPAGCAGLEQSVPPSYCAGLPQEGSPPACPPPPCATSMWVKNIPNSDCRDRPDLSPTGKGVRPNLVNPGASDLCNGLDYSCDGVADTGCGCSPIGKTEVCGAATTCNLGQRECLPGGSWGACSGGSEKARVDYCQDDDQDGYCVYASCANGVCPGDQPANGKKYRERTACTGFSTPATSDDCNDALTTINPSALETCDGVDNNCKSGIDETFPAKGTTCDNGFVGACKQTGVKQCDPSGTGLDCTAGTYGDVPATSFGPPLHGSCDRNCSGIVEIDTGFFNSNYPLYARPIDCTNLPTFESLCALPVSQQSTTAIFYLCATEPTGPQHAGFPPQMLYQDPTGKTFAPACGSQMLFVLCTCKTGIGCAGSSGQLITPTWR